MITHTLSTTLVENPNAMKKLLFLSILALFILPHPAHAARLWSSN